MQAGAGSEEGAAESALSGFGSFTGKNNKFWFFCKRLIILRSFDFGFAYAQDDIIINKYIFKTSDNINSDAHYCGELISA